MASRSSVVSVIKRAGAQRPGGLPASEDDVSESLLNANQRRRLGTHLPLLLHDLSVLPQAPGLQRAGPPFERIRHIVARIEAEIDSIRREFAIADDRGPS